MSKNTPTLTKKAQIAQRRTELSRLVSQGIRRHADLADRLGVSVMTVRRDLVELERIYKEQTADRIVELQDRERMVSFERLEDAVAELQPMIHNPRTRIQAIRLLKELEERRAKLLGLDMPTKHAATDPTGQKEYGRIPDEVKKRALENRRRRELADVVDVAPVD